MTIAPRSKRSPPRSTSPPTSSRICRSSRSRCSAPSFGPARKSLAVAQDRADEKSFIEATGARVAPWRPVESLDDVTRAVAELGVPVVLKTRRYGYDGKGQAWIRSADEAEAAWEAIGGEPAVAEAGVAFRSRILRHRRALGRRPHDLLGLRRQRPPRRHPPPLDRPAARDRLGAGRGGARRRRRHRRSARPCRRPHRRVLRQRRRPGRQRDRPARPQQRPLDDRGRLHLAVRTAHPRHLRPAARLDRARCVGRDDGQSDRRRDRRLAGPASPSRGAHVHLYGKGEARPGRKMGHVTRLHAEMKIIGSFVSPYVRKVLGCMRLKGLSYEIDPITPFFGNDEFCGLSPLCRIPVLIDGDFSASDSSVICAYLDEAYPGHPLLPADPKDRARARWLEEYADTRLGDIFIWAYFYQKIVHPLVWGEPGDQQRIAKAEPRTCPPRSTISKPSFPPTAGCSARSASPTSRSPPSSATRLCGVRDRRRPLAPRRELRRASAGARRFRLDPAVRGHPARRRHQGQAAGAAGRRRAAHRRNARRPDPAQGDDAALAVTALPKRHQLNSHPAA